MDIEKRLEALQIMLPEPSTPKGNYVSVKRVGQLLYTSGNGSLTFKGKLGENISVEQGYQAARETMVQILSVLKAEIGDLNRIKQVVKLLGFVNSTEDFIEQPTVINGASDLLVDVFGEKGKHARSAISAHSLPFNLPVEIEMIVELEEE